MPASGGDGQVELTDGQAPPAGLLVDDLLLAGAALGGGEFRQRAVQRVAGEVDVAELVREHPEADHRVDEGLEGRVLVLGFRQCSAHHDEGAGQDLDVVGVAAVVGDLLFQTAVVDLGLVQGLLDGEDDLRPAGGEVLSVRGGACLDDDGVALRRAGNVQRALYGEVLALVSEDVQLLRLEEAAGLLVVEEGVVFPAVPQPGDDLHELPCAVVSGRVLGLLVQVVVARFGVRRGGHDVPARAAGAEVVEGGELPCQGEGFVVGRGRGRGEADVPGVHGERGQ
ncbi:hypothetical protein SMICM304S_09649 [Streptomyces microflavus]